MNEPIQQRDQIMRYFNYKHLKPEAQAQSKPFCELALWIEKNVPRNAERTTALRKLLEAKDCAVRAGLPEELMPFPQLE